MKAHDLQPTPAGVAKDEVREEDASAFPRLASFDAATASDEKSPPSAVRERTPCNFGSVRQLARAGSARASASRKPATSIPAH